MRKAILVCCVVVVACLLFAAGLVLGRHYYSYCLHTRTYYGPHGATRQVTSKYPAYGWSVDSMEWWKHRHGCDIFYDKEGNIEAKGEWRDGQPWDGKCFIYAAGDAGSWGGLGHYETYEEGVRVNERPPNKRMEDGR